MQRLLRRVVGLGPVILGCTLAGCGEQAPPPAAGDAVEVTPAMEQMKAEMMQNMQKSKGKSAGATGRR